MNIPIQALPDYTVDTSNFFWTFRLNYPKQSKVVISVPHDAPAWPQDFDGFFHKRKTSSKADLRAWLIARDLMRLAPVHVIRNCFPRNYVEVNTTRDKAFVDPNLACVYDNYHHTVANLLSSADRQDNQPETILLDLHGFTEQPPYGSYDCILGTRNRATIHGDSRADIYLAECLERNGIKTFLPKSVPLRADSPDRYNGGETIWRHGQHRRNAIQLEVHRDFRQSIEGPRVRLIDALCDFIDRYNDVEGGGYNNL